MVARLQASSDLTASDAGLFYANGETPVPGGDTAWLDLGPVDVGQSPGISGDCDAGSIAVSLFDAPTAPTNYTGATTYTGYADSLPYVVPSTGYYEANIDLTQGAIHIGGGLDNCTNNTRNIRFERSL